MKIALIMIVLGISAGPRSQDILQHMFALARSHDTRALVELASDERVRHERLTANAINVALYVSNPNEFKDRFITNFPTTTLGVMQDLYEQIELKRLTPQFLFSFKALGTLARKGSPPAIKKLFLALSVSDGVVGEQLCDDVNQLFVEQPRLAVDAISSSPVPRRRRVYSCFKLLDSDERRTIADAIKASAAGTASGKRAVREICAATKSQKSEP